MTEKAAWARYTGVRFLPMTIPLPSVSRRLLLSGLLATIAASTAFAAVPADYRTLPATAPDPQADLADFSEYTWRLFAALNWPALPGQRGVPDPAASLGDPGPTVWQTYKRTDQIFLTDAVNPGPWNAGATATASLHYHSKAPDSLPLPPSIQQAVGGWLTDIHSNPTYYEIGVNQTSYDYIRTNGFYNANTVNQAARVAFPTGSLEVKASWRILTAADNPDRYHTLATQVMTFDAAGKPTNTYRDATVGLVGLHIVYQAPGFPQWVWATFEHVDNAPDADDATGTKAAWSYYNADCTGEYCEPNVSPVASGQPFATPNQVTRITPIRPAVAASNARWQQLLTGTAFQYYRLIAPQWPSDPNDPGNPQGTPTPGTVANITMESYIQPTSSCMDCHSTARVPNSSIKSNYSFLFLFAQTPATATATTGGSQ